MPQNISVSTRTGLATNRVLRSSVSFPNVVSTSFAPVANVSGSTAQHPRSSLSTPPLHNPRQLATPMIRGTIGVMVSTAATIRSAEAAGATPMRASVQHGSSQKITRTQQPPQ